MFKPALGRVREKRPLSRRLYDRFVHKYGDHDLDAELQRRARAEAADYVRAAMPDAVMFASRWHLLEAALGEAAPDGACLEFGVEKGDSLNFCARILARGGQVMHGFDSFQGLPEAWSGTRERAGKFSQGGRLPQVLPNVRLHPGWFAETLPRFLAEDPRPVAFAHIDCDIYSSTRTVLGAVAPRLRTGAIVVFDEYFNYHGWQQHEFRAWQEFVHATGTQYTYRGFCGRGKQVYVKIL
jgi:hypothetical protein